MEKEELMFTKGDNEGSIDELIEWLNLSKKTGATLYKMEWHEDFQELKCIRTYKIKTDEELKKEEILKLKNRLKELEE